MYSRFLGIYLPALIFILTVWFLITQADLVGVLTGYMSGMNAVSYVTYVAILTLAVVAMPVTVMPLIPVAATILGPLMTAILSVIGWTLGGGISFLIARYLGRPAIERFVSFEKLDRITDSIPQDARFISIILLRLTLPVDLVSYALGFSKSIGFLEYIVATFIGVIWFSFAFAYMGDALLNQNIILLIELGAASLLVFTLCWILITKKRKHQHEGDGSR